MLYNVKILGGGVCAWR